MKNKKRTYIAIDLKSFYASVECVERGLDPLAARLVVADSSRSSKTICLAVSPALKAYGIPGRPRLFEVEQRIRDIERSTGEKVSYVVATPQMRKYMEYSSRIYRIYLKYIAPEDIHVYSIDEVFMDVTAYLNTYGMTANELAMTMIKEVLGETGITATAGIGTNLYLCKIAMDIVAKHMPADNDGVRIAELDERSYRLGLWDHRPLTDFWRVGVGYARRLEEHGMFTMGDVARCAVNNEEVLYRLFGVNAQLLIDHSFGVEPCTIADIKAYKPESNSLGSGQVLHCPYDYEKCRLIVKEMVDQLVLELVRKRVVTDQISLNIGYDISNLSDPDIRRKYKGKTHKDHYGREVPEPMNGSIRLSRYTSLTSEITEAVMELYKEKVNPNLLIRRVTVTAGHIISEDSLKDEPVYEQMDLFTDYGDAGERKKAEKQKKDKERRIQQAVIDIQDKYGKNALLKGMDLLDDAQTINRNSQVGGHKA
jgi:DNA polymerase V